MEKQNGLTELSHKKLETFKKLNMILVTDKINFLNCLFADFHLRSILLFIYLFVKHLFKGSLVYWPQYSTDNKLAY